MPGELPPGPRYPAFIQGMGLWTRPLAFLERCRDRYGKRFTVRFPLEPPFVMLSTPDAIKAVYTAPADVLHPGEGAVVLKPIVGSRSVLLLDEDEHMEQRKLLLPAFHGERMERLQGLVSEVTEQEVASWPRDHDVELHPRMQALTLEIILRAVFGFDPGPRLDNMRERLSSLLAHGDSPITMLPEPPNFMLELLDRVGPITGFLSTRTEVDELLYELIAERRAADAGAAERDDVLAMLLEARHEDGSPMSDVEIRDELMTLLVAGHETTATTLAWAFERLAREDAVRERLTREVRGGDEEAYLTATIQETLRRRPVLPNTAPRRVNKSIEVDGWSYPVGCCLVASAYLTHHDADIYPEPYAFRPERFLDTKPGTYSWIPFGGGRRRCIGASFATLEMKVVLTSVLRRYELRGSSLRHEVPRRRNITVRPTRGATVSFGPPAREPAPA